MFKAVITTVVMALSEKQKNCSSDKTTTVCGDSSESLQLPTKPHSRGCESTYNKVLFTPPTMCRLTINPIRSSASSETSVIPCNNDVPTHSFPYIMQPFSDQGNQSPIDLHIVKRRNKSFHYFSRPTHKVL